MWLRTSIPAKQSHPSRQLPRPVHLKAMGPAVVARAAASVQPQSGDSNRTPLLPHHVHQTYGLAPPPIRFPSSTSSQNPLSVSKVGKWPSGIHAPSVGPHSQQPLPQPRAPRVTRECLISEIKCYGRYIVACLLIFGLGGILSALYLSQKLSN